jgi:antitoxin (DNA-binding transcriptional repressor) of toxin-antitoxin stability system
MNNIEILDIQEAIVRWDEIVDRTEAGESFIIAVAGEPKVRLEPLPPGEKPVAATSD